MEKLGPDTGRQAHLSGARHSALIGKFDFFPAERRYVVYEGAQS